MDESIVKHLEQQQLGTLTLSAAIRIGARMRPQCKLQFFSGGGSCALGAAVEAKYGITDTGFPTNWEEVFGAPPVITSEVIFRNDRGETREQIADWLESLGY